MYRGPSTTGEEEGFGLNQTMVLRGVSKYVFLRSLPTVLYDGLQKVHGKRRVRLGLRVLVFGLRSVDMEKKRGKDKREKQRISRMDVEKIENKKKINN